MSDAEAKLHKLKVTELKELLAKHHLVQSGKKDELVKRLLDNNISPEGDDELVEPPADDAAPPKPTSASAKPPSSAKRPSKSAAPPSSSTAPSASVETKDLTPEQQAMKARAERFGIPFNPNPVPTNRAAKATPPSATPGAGKPDSATAKAAPAPAKKDAPKDAAAAPAKKGIDSAPLGISQEVLAARAAKFGLPEKKEAPAAAPVSATADKPVSNKPLSKSAEAKKASAEVTPEMAARNAEEEEKKRKRAEKFGTGATNGSSAPDSKKVKV